MKHISIFLFLIFISVSVWADSANIQEDPAVTIIKTDTTLLSGKYLRADPQTAFLGYDNVAGFFESYSTEDIFYQWQNNIDSAGSFGNISASPSSGEITILSGGDGRYKIHRDTGIHGEPNTSYNLAIFVNNAAVSESHTSPGTPPESFPVFAHLSSFSGDATFDVNSSLSFLFYSDNDQIKIVESGSGNGVDEWCFEYDIHFNINHVPHFLKLGEGQYIGGANHYADALAFDNLSSRWTDLRVAAEDIKNVGAQADYKNSTLKFAFPNDGTQTRYILNGIVKTRVRHVDGVVCSSGHEYWLDEAKIEDLLGIIADSATVEVALVAGDVITIKERPSLPNKFFHRHRTRLSIVRIGN